MNYEELKMKLNKLLHSKWFIVLIVLIIICSIFYYIVIYPPRISALEGVKIANKKAKSLHNDACLYSLRSDPYNTKEGKSTYWIIVYFSPSSSIKGKFGKKDVIENEHIEITVQATGEISYRTWFSSQDQYGSINVTMDSTDAFNVLKKNSTYKKFIQDNPIAQCSMYYPWEPKGGSNSSFFGWSMFFKQYYGSNLRYNQAGFLINATTGNLSIAAYDNDEKVEIVCYLINISIVTIVIITIVFLFYKHRKKRPISINSPQNKNHDGI